MAQGYLHAFPAGFNVVGGGGLGPDGDVHDCLVEPGVDFEEGGAIVPFSLLLKLGNHFKYGKNVFCDWRNNDASLGRYYLFFCILLI